MAVDGARSGIDLLRLAATRLEPMLDELVFVGGATTALFITDSAAADVRPTKDVDVIVEVSSRSEYARFEKRIRQLGFTQPVADDDLVICRWQSRGLIVDLMPTDERILGFGNPWFAGAINTAVTTELVAGMTIRHVTAPYFVATKLAAFDGRGNDDYMASADFEDLMAVIDGREGIIEELAGAPAVLRGYVAKRMHAHFADERFHRALPGLILDAGESPSRVQMLLDRVSLLVALHH